MSDTSQPAQASARWELVQSLFHRAVSLDEAGRRGFLQHACGEDAALFAEVMRMVEHDAGSTSLLDRGVVDAAGPLLADDLPPGLAHEAFGAYRLVRLLGAGGTGVVYLARRDDLGSVAAIKILRDAWLSPARRERFVDEQRVLARLHHPSIARLYDADSLPDGTPWFAMEYVEGVPITEHCRQRHASLGERLRLVRATCEAVQYAHRQMIVHRDLKPSNVFVTPDGAVKLLDFGISRPLDRPRDPTVTGLRLLTPAYAAPEQLRGSEAGVQTDVYALGAILYELLAGRPLVDLAGCSPAEAERLILEVEPTPPSAVAPVEIRRASSRQRWADIDTLCLTALHKDSARRYGSMEALLRDLVHYERSEPLEARPDSFGYRMRTFARRNAGRLAAAAAVCALLGSTVVFYTWRLAGARNAAVAEARRTERIQRFMLHLFDGGEVEGGPSSSLKVATLVDRGLEQARALDSEPLVQAELFHTLGTLYQRLGRLDLADTALQAALDTKRRVLGPSSAETTRSTTALGLLRSTQSRFDEAEQLVRQALDTTRAREGETGPGMAAATAALGQVLEERGKYTEAVPVLETAVGLASATGVETLELATAVYELGHAHFYLGHLDESEALHTRALVLHRKLLGARHAAVADDLINLGAIQHERGRYADAERFHREALDINRAWYGPDDPQTASNLTMLGRALLYQNRHDEADAILKEALAVQQRVFGPVHRKVASALNDLIGVALKRDRLDEAEDYAQHTLDAYRTLYSGKHFTVGVGVANLASVKLARKDYAAAERGFREAVALYSETQSPDHLNTGIARIKLGRTLLRQRRLDQAHTELTAGYDIVSKRAEPTVSWLVAARDDLVELFDALNQPEKAAAMRAEIATVAARVAGTPGRN